MLTVALQVDSTVQCTRSSITAGGGQVHISFASVLFEKNMKIIDSLEELDDVDSVEHNMSN